MRFLVLAIFVSALLQGCETGLDAAYDDFRSQVPPTCKDYCEEQVACERASGTGPDDPDAFTAQVHECVVLCGAYASEGAYVWRNDPTGLYERFYDDHIGGEDLMRAFECLYDIGAYRCVDTGDGYIHRFNPPVPSVCDAANTCMAALGIDYVVFWQPSPDGFGGNCLKSGNSNIDVMFF